MGFSGPEPLGQVRPDRASSLLTAHLTLSHGRSDLLQLDVTLLPGERQRWVVRVEQTTLVIPVLKVVVAHEDYDGSELPVKVN
jgi:hypothetical protein